MVVQTLKIGKYFGETTSAGEKK